MEKHRFCAVSLVLFFGIIGVCSQDQEDPQSNDPESFHEFIAGLVSRIVTFDKEDPRTAEAFLESHVQESFAGPDTKTITKNLKQVKLEIEQLGQEVKLMENVTGPVPEPDRMDLKQIELKMAKLREELEQTANAMKLFAGPDTKDLKQLELEIAELNRKLKETLE